MRKSQRRLCNDVFVVRSAECWTDHKLLKAKLMLRESPKPKKPVKRKRFAVSRLSDEKTGSSIGSVWRKQLVVNGAVKLVEIGNRNCLGMA